MRNDGELRRTVCGICGGDCLVDVRVRDGEITQTSPALFEDGTRSRICVKGAALKTFVHSPERVRHPLRRVGEKGEGRFEQISWDEAFSEIAAKLRSIKTENGAKATAFYCGHPKWPRCAVSELAAEYGSPNIFTESSTCHTAPTLAHKLTFGCAIVQPDMKNCRTLICWGADPAYSRGANGRDAFSVKERGGTLIVIDPRLTPVAERADLHLRPRPGTDGALALSMASVILSEGLEDTEFLEKYAVGVEKYRAYAAEFTPERAGDICGVPLEDIVKAARLYATGGPAAILTTSCGAAHCPNGVQNLRAVFLLEALTGNFDRTGGNCAPPFVGAALNGFHHAATVRTDAESELYPERFPVWNELVKNEGQVMGLDRTLLSGEPYPIRALIGFGMNYRMFPEAARMLKALKNSEFFVDVDMFLTDTARCADIVLPCQTAPERDFVYMRPDGRLLFLPRALEAGDCRSDVEIVQGISAALGLHGRLTGMRSHEEYLQWMLEPTGVTLSELKAAPEGIKTERKPRKRGICESGINTPSGRIEFVSSLMGKYSYRDGYDALPVYREYAEQNPSPGEFPFVLCVGSRLPWFFHSRTYRLPWLSRLDEHPLVTISPADAARLSIENGDKVRVVTPKGEVSLTAEVSSRAREGVVFTVHDDDMQSVNDIVGADYYDPVSGFPGFRSYFCDLRKEAAQ